MPVPMVSRRFLVAALVHLGAASLLVAAGGLSGRLDEVWDATLWLLLVGFIGFTTSGFGLHLFSQVFRRPAQSPAFLTVVLAALEASAILGAVSFLGLASGYSVEVLASAAILLLAGELMVLGGFLDLIRTRPLSISGPAPRPGDAVTLPLFLASWLSAAGFAALVLLSALNSGPGFGWWLAGVHLFVLGHGALLIGAVSLRLVPRSMGADPPRILVFAVAGFGISGALLVPTGMLLASPGAAGLLDLLALPEAGFAVALVATLGVLGARATTPRKQLALHLAGTAFLLVGGALGLGMAATSDYDPLVAHAWVNVVGFLGLTILLMWFGMIAPFQRVSHAWTSRMLWTLACLWVGAVALVAGSAFLAGPPAFAAASVGGALLLVIAVVWAVGTVPVLFPSLPPFPGRRPVGSEGRPPAGGSR